MLNREKEESMKSFRRIVALGALLGTLLYVPGLFAQAARAADPAFGNWELNVAKSKFSPGPAPKSQTRTYEAAAGGVKFTAKGIGADGKPTLVQYTASYDGKDYPITGSADADTISLKKIDDFTVEATQKKAGKVVITTRREISKDGKTMTAKSKGTNASGQTVENVLIFDKK
jgi:hypothetical protein